MEKHNTFGLIIFSVKNFFVLGKNDFELVGRQVLSVGKAAGKRHIQQYYKTNIFPT